MEALSSDLISEENKTMKTTDEPQPEICRPRPVVRQLEVINALDCGLEGSVQWRVSADLFPGGDREAHVPAGRKLAGQVPHASRQCPGASKWAMATGHSCSLVPTERKQMGSLGDPGIHLPLPRLFPFPQGNSEWGKHGGAGENQISSNRGAASFTYISLVGLVGPRAVVAGPLPWQGSLSSFRHHGHSRCGYLHVLIVVRPESAMRPLEQHEALSPAHGAPLCCVLAGEPGRAPFPEQAATGLVSGQALFALPWPPWGLAPALAKHWNQEEEATHEPGPSPTALSSRLEQSKKNMLLLSDTAFFMLWLLACFLLCDVNATGQFTLVITWFTS